MKLLWIALLSLSVSALTAQKNTTFTEWDSDNDNVIERYEFTAIFVNDYFNDWDIAKNNEEGLIEEDFFKRAYTGLDTDNDNYLSDEEWLIGYNYFFEDYVLFNDINFVDLNEDGNISYQEYYDVLYDTDFFTDIDVDNDEYISEYELANYAFERWDIDGSQTLSRSEFKRFDWYYLDL